MSGAEPRVFGLIGHPVGHSVSPAMHAAAYRACALPHVYKAFDVPTAAELERVVREIRSGAVAGANVTVPHKRAVMALVDAVDPSAADVGAANVLRVTEAGQVEAHNTDVLALRDDLELALRSGGAAAPQPGRERALVIGAGGAGLAAIAACKRIGFRRVVVTTRSWTTADAMQASSSGERARALGALTVPWPALSASAFVESLSALAPSWDELATAADLIVQATSAGMLGGPPGEEVCAILPWGSLPRSACLYDLVYNPPVTPFLQRGRARGLIALDGLGMLVGQAARSFTLWTGLAAPVDVMRAAAEGALRKPTVSA